MDVTRVDLRPFGAAQCKDFDETVYYTWSRGEGVYREKESEGYEENRRVLINGEIQG